MADSNKWRRERIEAGLCGRCGKSRKNGTTRFCRMCADKYKTEIQRIRSKVQHARQ